MKRNLREKELSLKLALDAAKIGIWKLDAHADQTWWDEGFNKIIGRDAVETLQHGGVLLEFIHAEDRDYLVREVRAAIVHCRDIDCEFRLIDASGIMKHVLLRGPIRPGQEEDLRAPLLIFRNSEALKTD
jgi:PAS domain-containing protein